MEYVGRRARKGIEGQGTVSGSVIAFEQETGVFKVVYDDGEFVEVSLMELHKLLETPSELAQNAELVSGEQEGNLRKRLKCVIEGDEAGEGDKLLNACGNSGEVSLDLNKGLHLDGDGSKVDNRGDGAEFGGKLLGLDWNDGVNQDLNEDLDIEGVGMSPQRMIDLNVDVNEGVENFGGYIIRRDFDLNLELVENEGISLGDGEVGVHSGDELIKEEVLADAGDRGQNEDNEDVEERKMIDLNVDVSEDAEEFGGDRRMRDFDLNLELAEVEVMHLNDHDHASNASELDTVSHGGLYLPTFIDVSDKEVTLGGRATQCTVLPPKVELPPSSGNLDLNGVSPFDLLSVYAFLRSFSTFLFLSPFELGEFVESVTCSDSTSLFDSVHVSLLRILRKHLQSLSSKGCLSASNCLRSLNWEFLDLITWPMFVVEYLLLHSPGYIPGLNRRQSKLVKKCFYKLPVSAKVEILRHLCDDVVGAEVFRLEINKRVAGTARDVYTEQNKKCGISRKRKAAIDAASTSRVTDDVVQKRADWNSDECCLCKMDGDLICCDGCPAAFHARCVGVVHSLLPEGDWYCPECQIEKDKPWLKMWKSVRGADFLGTDPYGRRYHSSCGYLLVSESFEDKNLYWSYNRDDIPTLVEALEPLEFVYDAIIRAICKSWNIVQGTGGTRNNTYSGSACPKIPDDAHTLSDNGKCDVIDIPLDVAHHNNPDPVNNYGANYVNYYQFACEASSVFDEMASKPSGEDGQSLIQDAIAGEQKAISNRFSVFSWSNILNLSMSYKKEKCGWCSCCKAREMEMDCLFITKGSNPGVENLTSEALGIGLRKNRENHLIDVICQMICIEDHLRGLLLGPWLDAHHSMLWRSRVAEVDGVASLQSLLLMMELNLHHLAFSAEWGKHVDTVVMMGSASHIINSCPQPKRFELRLFWWRGGAGSRKLFNWKALPRSLASRAARQGGLKKIRGVLYPKSREYAKRKKCDVWRAAVESSASVDQLALQIRELDANIKWDKIWNANYSLKADKRSKKSVESFREVIIRKKIFEGTVARYLLDFSKCRSVPDVVVRHGTILDDSNRKKKYWLYEAHMPLHLLKSFEEKQIALKSQNSISEELGEISGIRKKPSMKKGFAYLFSRAEGLENSH